MFDVLIFSTHKPSFDNKLQRYLMTDTEDIQDGLMWWYKKRKMFPQLSCMGRDYLSIPGEYSLLLCLS